MAAAAAVCLWRSVGDTLRCRHHTALLPSARAQPQPRLQPQLHHVHNTLLYTCVILVEIICALLPLLSPTSFSVSSSRSPQLWFCLGLICAAVCLRVTRPAQFHDASQVSLDLCQAGAVAFTCPCRLSELAVETHALCCQARPLPPLSLLSVSLSLHNCSRHHMSILLSPAPTTPSLALQASGSFALSLLTGAPRSETASLLLLPPSHTGLLHLAMFDSSFLSAGRCIGNSPQCVTCCLHKSSIHTTPCAVQQLQTTCTASYLSYMLMTL